MCIFAIAILKTRTPLTTTWCLSILSFKAFRCGLSAVSGKANPSFPHQHEHFGWLRKPIGGVRFQTTTTLGFPAWCHYPRQSYHAINDWPFPSESSQSCIVNLLIGLPGFVYSLGTFLTCICSESPFLCSEWPNNGKLFNLWGQPHCNLWTSVTNRNMNEKPRVF